jgi:hypothetical protein
VCAHTHTHIFTHSLSLSLSLSLSHTHTHTHTSPTPPPRTSTHARTHTHTCARAHTHTYICIYIHTHTVLSLSLSLSRSLFPYPSKAIHAPQELAHDRRNSEKVYSPTCVRNTYIPIYEEHYIQGTSIYTEHTYIMNMCVFVCVCMEQTERLFFICPPVPMLARFEDASSKSSSEALASFYFYLFIFLFIICLCPCWRALKTPAQRPHPRRWLRQRHSPG